MKKAHLVGALALAALASAPAQAETLHRRQVRTHARRVALPPPAPVAPAVAGQIVPEDAQVGSAIDQASAAIDRAGAAGRAVTTNAFGPILRVIYPPGQSGDL